MGAKFGNSLKICCACCAFLLLSSSCDNRPKGVLSERKTVTVMSDLDVASAYAGVHRNDFNSDSLRISFRESVLRSRGVTQAELDSTLSWYARHPDKYMKLCEKIVKRVEGIQRTAFPSDVYAGQDQGAGLWEYPRQLTLSPLDPQDGVAFRISAESIESGSRLHFKAKIPNRKEVAVLLGVKYDDERTSYTTRTMGVGQDIDFMLQTDSSATVREIYGKIIAMDRESLPVLLDSISLLTEPLDADKYYLFHSQRMLEKAGTKHKTADQ